MKINNIPSNIFHTGQSGKTAPADSKPASKNGDIEVMGKCIRIAAHIINGDKVPPQDDKYLFEHYPDMHSRAWMLRKVKEDPDEYESEVDEDEEKAESGGSELPEIPDAGEIAAAPEIPEFGEMDFTV